MRFVFSFILLFAFWWLLSGQTNPFLIKSGVVVSALVAYLSVRMGLADEESQPMPVIPRLLLYAPWLFWQVVLSNWDVVKRVWTPGLQIAPHLIRVPCKARTGFGRVTYANSITLTPGTVTVEAGDETYLVHALHSEAAAGLESGEMHRRVQALEGSA
jgi:multicomponent Na+:H+ antiporter subunit E